MWGKTRSVQETDQNHGMLKSVHGRNPRAKLAENRLDVSEAINFEAADITLIVFGGTDEVAGRIGGCKDAFAKAFSVGRNKRSWEMVGAAPSTMRCLESDKARVDELDPNFTNCKSIKAANHSATSMLTAKGFNGELMKVVSNHTAHENRPVTAPFTQKGPRSQS